MVPHPEPPADTRADTRADTWADTWAAAASDRDGFYARSGPGGHFATSASTSPLFAETVAAVLGASPQITSVLDVGAGGGQLLTGLARVRPDLDLTGVDLRPRPAGLDPGVGWLQDRYDLGTATGTPGWQAGAVDRWFSGRSGPALVVATELLDDLPLAEQAGAAASAWARRWWPDGTAEVGLHRDAAWAGLVTRLSAVGGRALLVDYGHLRSARPTRSTLASFRAGHQRPPTVDAGQNLTADVAVDAVAAAGERAGAQTVALLRQRAAVRRWAPQDPADGLARLVRRSERQALTGPGLGDHWWLLQQLDPPEPARLR